MILTVTLNPAVDKTAVIQNFQAGAVNRISELRIDAGGKGVNVSKVLASLGVDNVATGICGGATGQFILDALQKLGVRTEFISSAEETRTNLKIADPFGGTTDINEPGTLVTEEQLQLFTNKLAALSMPGDLVVFAGSLPPGAPTDYYAKLIAQCKANGVRTLVDTSGAALWQAAQAVPYILKPNLEELRQLTGTQVSTEGEILDLCHQLLKRGTEMIAVTLGSKGAIFVTRRGGAIAADALPVTVRSTVGSGDAFAAAMSACVQRGADEEETLAYAMAAGAVNAMTSGTAMPDGAQIRLMANQVQLRRICNSPFLRMGS
jgi:1-phosphofructokinase